MKKYLIPISAALILGLAACGQPAEEVTPTAAATPAPKPTVVATATAAPTATVPPVIVSTPEPTPAETALPPTPTPASTPKPVVTPAPEPTPEPVLTLPPEVVPTPEPTAEPIRPSDEEVLEAYHEAEEAYSWFDLTTLPVDYSQQQEVDGDIYYRVADERFLTMDSLRGYLKSLFSDEVVDRLLPTEVGAHYTDIDGALYARDSDRGGREDRGGVILEVIWPQEGEPVLCAVRARVEVLDLEQGYPFVVIGEEIHEFPYQKVGDKWVFTYFEALF